MNWKRNKFSLSDPITHVTHIEFFPVAKGDKYYSLGSAATRNVTLDVIETKSGSLKVSNSNAKNVAHLQRAMFNTNQPGVALINIRFTPGYNICRLQRLKPETA